MSSLPPVSDSSRSRSASTEATLVKSQRTGTPRPPAASTSSAVSSIVSGRFIGDADSRVVRPAAYTVAPSAPSSTAIARPHPLVAPATTTTLSCNGFVTPHPYQETPTVQGHPGGDHRSRPPVG